MEYLDVKIDAKIRAMMMALLAKTSQVTWIGWGDVLNILAILSFVSTGMFMVGLRILTQGSMWSIAVTIVAVFYALGAGHTYSNIKGVFARDHKVIERVLLQCNGKPGVQRFNTVFVLHGILLVIFITGFNSFSGQPALLPAPIVMEGFEMFWLHLFGRTFSYLCDIGLVIYAMRLIPDPSEEAPISQSNNDTNT